MLIPFCFLHAPYWAVIFISSFIYPINEDEEGCEDRNCCNCPISNSVARPNGGGANKQMYLFEMMGTSWQPHCNECELPILDRIAAELVCSEFHFQGKTFHVECCRGQISNLMEFNGVLPR